MPYRRFKNQLGGNEKKKNFNDTIIYGSQNYGNVINYYHEIKHILYYLQNPWISKLHFSLMHPFLVISIHSYDRIFLVAYKKGYIFEEADIYWKKLNSK